MNYTQPADTIRDISFCGWRSPAAEKKKRSPTAS